MSGKKGFTLAEIIVVMIIIGILADLAIVNYFTVLQQQSAKAAQTNLITIYSAEKNYFFSHGGAYCTTACFNLTQINFWLTTNINDNYFTYNCNYNKPFCVATNKSNNAFILTIDLTKPLVTG